MKNATAEKIIFASVLGLVITSISARAMDRDLPDPAQWLSDASAPLQQLAR